MRELLRRRLTNGATAIVAHSTRADGDLSPAGVPAAVLAERRRQAVDVGAWHWVDQVHGSRVVVVEADTCPSEPPASADALVTTEPGRVLAVHSGDCVPVGFVHPSGAIGVAHAGWKGLRCGILEETIAALRNLADTAGPAPREGQTDSPIMAAVGPHIRTDRYEFDGPELDELAQHFGDHVVGVTRSGSRALDLTAATTGVLRAAGVDVVTIATDCTAAMASDYWSYRARAETGRIALVAWMESP